MKVNYITDCYYVPEDEIKCYELPQCPACENYPTYNMNPCPFCGVELEYPKNVEVEEWESNPQN